MFRRRNTLTTLTFLVCVAFAQVLLAPLSAPVLAQDIGEQPIAGFPVAIPGAAVQDGSVTIANITGNSNPEIIVGASDGVVYAIGGTGQRLWQFRTNTALNNAWSGRDTATRINSAPAVGDITGDGVPEIVVAVGGVTSENENGGVVVLDNAGRLLPGWPQLTVDEYDPRGITEGVKSSPVIADFTGDGVPEIGYGAFDQRIYLKDRNGRDLPGWPRFARDTVWSSPAAVDLTGDGVNEMVIGIDAHNEPAFGDKEGGYVLALRGDNTMLPGWPQFQDDAVFSSPAVADLDNDGDPEIVIGSGNFWRGFRSNNALGRTVTAYRTDGSVLWRQRTDGSVSNAPAIGDVNGDGNLDVVVVADDGDDKAYAFDGRNGALLWKELPKNIFYTPNGGDRAHGNVILGDFDGDGDDDVFAPVGGQVAIMRGQNGSHFTGTSNPWGNVPVYSAQGIMTNTPALGDLNGDGKLELVTATSVVKAWTMEDNTGVATWPMFRRNPLHTGVVETPSLDPSIEALDVLSLVGQRRTYTISFDADWTITETDRNNIVSLNRTSGGPSDPLVLTLTAPRQAGTYTAQLLVRSSTAPDVTIPITIRAVAQLTSVYTPLVIR